MSSAQDIDVSEHVVSHDPEETPSAVPKNDSDSPTLLSFLSQMQSQLNENSRLLHSLLTDDGQLPAKRSRLDVEPTEALLNVPFPASLNANNDAAQTARFDPAQTGTASTAQTVTVPLNDILTRPSEEDAISLFGGAEFDGNPQEVPANETFLDDIDQELMPQAQQGPPVSIQLAKIVNGKFALELDHVKRKEILSKYSPPGNCHSLQTPRVNPEIWTKLGANARKNDMKISALQNTMVKATAAVTVTANDLLTAKQQQSPLDYKGLIAKLIDAIVLIGHVNSELTFRRRDMLRPHLSSDFKQACSRNVKPTTLLFGDNLPEVVKQLQATNKIVNRVTNFPTHSATSYQRVFRQSSGFNTTPRHATATQSQNSFLGYRGKTAFPPKQNNSFAKKRYTKN